MKEFYGSISITGRVNFSIKAKDEDEARDIVLNDMEGLEMVLVEGSRLEITEVDWSLIENSERGNVQLPHISSFEVIEEE
jgi:hypothetical protein